MDVPGYIDAILARFRNPAIAHKLAQIAWDGSQKLPVRLLSAVEVARFQGADVTRLVTGVAAWMAFVRRQAQAGADITDPLGPQLTALGRAATSDPAADVASFLTLRAVFPAGLAAAEPFRAAVEAAYAALTGPQPRSVLAI
jgi:fructuronate reductase